MIDNKDVEEFNSTTDMDVKLGIAKNNGFKTPAQFRKAVKEQESKNSTLSTPEKDKNAKNATALKNASSKSDEENKKDIQEGNDLLNKGKPVITLDQIIEAYADGDERVKSILKKLPSNPIGGIMSRKVVGRDTKTGENVYETNNDYKKRNKAAFDRLGLDWDKNKADRFLVAKTIENEEVNKAKSDIREGRGETWSGLDRLIRYAGDIVAPRSMEELDRRLSDENATQDFPTKDYTVDMAENAIQTLGSPVLAPIKYAGKYIPKLGRAVAKVGEAVDKFPWKKAVPVIKGVPDNLGDVTASEVMDKAIYDDPSNTRSTFSGADIGLGGLVNLVAPIAVSRQNSRLGRKIGAAGEGLTDKITGKPSSNRYRDQANFIEENNAKAMQIVKDVQNKYGIRSDGTIPSKNGEHQTEAYREASMELYDRLGKDPNVRAAYDRLYPLPENADDISALEYVPIEPGKNFNRFTISDPRELREKADYIDFMQVPKSEKNKIKGSTRLDETGDVVRDKKQKSFWKALWEGDDLVDNAINRNKKITLVSPDLSLKQEREWDDLVDRDRSPSVFAPALQEAVVSNWLPNKLGKSEMVTSMLPAEWFPTQEETEDKATIDQAYNDLPITNSGKNLFRALNEEDPNNENEDEEDPYDISFMPTSNRYIKKAGK